MDFYPHVTYWSHWILNSL